MRIRFKYLLGIVLLSLLVLVSCERECCIPAPPTAAYLQIPPGFPDMPQPPDNELNEARYLLGKKLFFDPILSVDSTISCASCHKTSLALADDVPVSPGVQGRLATRNASTLFNVGYLPYYLREGGVPTLEMQVLVPIQEHEEMDFNIVAAANRLARKPTYVRMSQDAYGRTPDAYVITRAIAAYERTMVSGNSAYDQYTFQGKGSAMSASALRGRDLFFSSKTNCSSCHSGLFFTDNSFRNNGLDTVYQDVGRMRLTLKPEDEGLFRVPTLRNVAVTAPYMHNGSVATLEEVVDHYIKGGEAFWNKDSLIQPLVLTAAERQDLLSFLQSLTDQEVLTDPRFLP